MKPMTKQLPPIILTQVQEMIIALGLEDELEAGRFTCPTTEEQVTWDSVGRIKIDGERVELYSVNARLINKVISIH